MKYMIISLTEKIDCNAITEDGKKIIVDPFVGCAWNFEDRIALLNSWFETKKPYWYEKEKDVLIPHENDFKLIYEPKAKTLKQKILRTINIWKN